MISVFLKRYLNSNIEIHKFLNSIASPANAVNLNSNIEIHKYSKSNSK